MTAAATPGTTVWVYRNTVYGYPWYTDVRKTLEDPAYAPWYFKFAGAGPWYVTNKTTDGCCARGCVGSTPFGTALRATVDCRAQCPHAPARFPRPAPTQTYRKAVAQGRACRYSQKCDSAQPTLCSDLYHSQEQSPG